MGRALNNPMPLRTFAARDGTTWSVWRIQSSTASDALGMPRSWLMFQNEAGGERRRLVEYPASWQSLPDERLELLCRVAVPARLPDSSSPPTGTMKVDGRKGSSS